MKKIIGVALFVLVSAFSLSAQVSVHGWGEAAFVPIYSKGDDLKSIAHVDWAGSPYLGLLVSGAWKTIGFDVGIVFRSEKFIYPGTSDEEFSNLERADIWWKPNDYFKMSIGRTVVDTLRGKFSETYGLYSYSTGRISGYDGLRHDSLNPFAAFGVAPTASGQYKRFISVKAQDAIFSRFITYRAGAIVEVTPFEGLLIGAAVSPGMGGKVSIGDVPDALAQYMPVLPDLYGGDNTIKDVYESVQAAVGYTIKNIGLARVGYFGKITDDPKKNIAVADLEKNRRIEAAFAFTGVGGFVIDTGLKYFLDDTADFPVTAASGVSFQKIPFVLRGRIDVGFGGDNDTRFAANINPSMFLSEKMNVGADVLFGIQGEDKNLGFDTYVQWLYSNGSVKTGAALTLPLNGGPEKLGWAIPVVFEYWF
jgi:hypothetical protein